MQFPLNGFFFIYTPEILDIILTSMLFHKVHVLRHVMPVHSSCSAYFINPTNFLCFCFHCQWHYCFTL